MTKLPTPAYKKLDFDIRPMGYVRPSQLGTSEFCPRAAEENEKSGISRYAVMSTAWHAKLAGNDTLIGELHPDERAEVATYGTPTTTAHAPGPDRIISGELLDYESAEKELHVQVFERDLLVTEGTLDFAWVREVGGKRWAFVADLKRSAWAVPDGPDCLQLAAYGHAYAALRSCEGYTPGLWSGTDSEWSWGTPVDLTSPEALDLWLRLKRAAKNDARLMPETPEFKDKKRHVTGAHCNSCYGRMGCPSWAALAYSADKATPIDLTEQSAAEWLLRAQAMEDFAERIKDNVKVFAERGGPVSDPATKKRFLPVSQPGRKTVDVEALQKAGITVPYKQGKPFQKFGWVK